MGAVAWAIRHRSVSHPRSSNRTCRSPASGSPTGFTVRHTGSKPTARGFCTVITLLRPSTQQSRTAPVFDGVLRLIANHHEPLVSYRINRQLSSTGDSRLRGALPIPDVTTERVSTAIADRMRYFNSKLDSEPVRVRESVAAQGCLLPGPCTGP